MFKTYFPTDKGIAHVFLAQFFAKRHKFSCPKPHCPLADRNMAGCTLTGEAARFCNPTAWREEDEQVGARGPPSAPPPLPSQTKGRPGLSWALTVELTDVHAGTHPALKSGTSPSVP